MARAKDKEFRFDLRLSMAKDAKRFGIRSTARKWGCSRNTVRRWLRRYEEEGLQGLKERSHAPKSCPHKIKGEQAKKIIKLRKESGFGAKRLKKEFGLSCGHGAINRIISENGMSRKPKTKRQKKNDLRKVKAKLKAFERVLMDIKYLTDIALFLPQIRLMGLPRYQYTIRDVKTGLLFLAYGSCISKTLACICISRFLSFLRSLGIDLSEVTVQTDNGTEFDGQMVSPVDIGFRIL
jgi:transposase